MAGMAPLLLFLWVGLSLSGVTVSKGLDLQKRIVNGQPCDNSDRHYHVKLTGLDPDGSSNFCGGSLISDRWVLTAAHCWQPGRDMFAVVGVHPGPGQRAQIIREPVIYTDSNNKLHDLMLLQLPYPTNIIHIQLPNCGAQPKKKDKVQIAGHAATTKGFFDQRRPGQTANLHCTDMEVVDCQHLSALNFQVGQLNLNTIAFCGLSPGVDICLGDSGGGVVFKKMIYGVISFTEDKDFACKSRAGFMNLCAENYIDWIKKVTGLP